MKNTSQPIKVLIIGAPYAGLAAATNLPDLSEGRPQRFHPTEPAPDTKFPLAITIVDERDGYYHVIGSPLALTDSTFAKRSWTKFEDVPALQHPAVKFIHGGVNAVNTESKTAEVLPHKSKSTRQSVVTESYDYLLAASGLRRVAPVVPESLTRDDYLIEAGKHIDKVEAAVDREGMVVIGGGAVGIEMAAELKAIYAQLKVRLIHSKDRLMSSEPLPDDFKDKTLDLLRNVGVEVITGRRVTHIATPDNPAEPTRLTLSDGGILETSFVINAISHSTPTSGYLPQSVLTSEGYVKMIPTLHFLPLTVKGQLRPSPLPTGPGGPFLYDPYHLAAGDITHWTGIRRCGAAMHMGSYAAHNIYTHILSVLSDSSCSSTSSSTKLSSASTAIPNLTPYTKYKSLTAHPPMIGLALGTTGIAYSPTEGIKFGPQVLEMMFQDDLGFSICWNYMKLGEKPEDSFSTAGNDQERATRGTDDIIAGISASSSSSVSASSSRGPGTPSDHGKGDIEDLREGVDRLTAKTKVSPIRVEAA